MYNPYIIGKRVYLRQPTEDDALGRWHEWFSDEETTKYLADRFWPNTRENQIEFLKSLKNKSRLALSIITKANDEHIGVVSLSSINWVHRYADIAIVMGEKKYHKGGYSIEAFGLMLKAAFLRLNLRNIKSVYTSSNEESEAIHKIFKFTKVGEYKNLMFINGRYEEVLIWMLDKDTWLKRNMPEST